jgi:hypothetical protein
MIWVVPLWLNHIKRGRFDWVKIIQDRCRVGALASWAGDPLTFPGACRSNEKILAWLPPPILERKYPAVGTDVYMADISRASLHKFKMKKIFINTEF